MSRLKTFDLVSWFSCKSAETLALAFAPITHLHSGRHVIEEVLEAIAGLEKLLPSSSCAHGLLEHVFQALSFGLRRSPEEVTERNNLFNNFIEAHKYEVDF